MLRYLIEGRVARQQFRNRAVAPAQVGEAKSILFSVFSRYGDGINSFKVINEFIARHPGKTYYLVTSHQLRPYAEALVGLGVNLRGVRKRNFYQLLRIIGYLKRADIDLGFNPWGSGADSEFFLTFAREFFTFRSMKFALTANLYFRVRHYLGLPSPEGGEKGVVLPKRVHRILVSPFSTDIRKSLSSADIKALLAWLKHKFPESRAVLCLNPGDGGKVADIGEVDFFIFGKSEGRSRQFLRMVKECNLFVGVDAGPLHLADALGKPGLGLFGPSAPETVLDVGSCVVPFRAAELQGVFCALQSCPEPHCLHALFQNGLEKHRYSPSLHPVEERTTCRFLI
jgi:hypothetical protein